MIGDLKESFEEELASYAPDLDDKNRWMWYQIKDR